jgi:hypothetical protein
LTVPLYAPGGRLRIMAARKKSKRKPAVKSATKSRKRAISARSSTKTARKKAGRKRTTSRPKPVGGSAEFELKRGFQNRNSTRGVAPSPQPEDLQGLSRAEQADSESVDELAGEGNVFEAGAVAGVEEADSADEKAVHTREVSEDDVPEEYLDEQ